MSWGLRPIDDDFMKAIFTDNKPLVEYVLRVILDKEDLIVETSETQYDLNFFGSRSLSLDVFAKDSSGKSFNIEVQRADTGAIAQRARYHSAALDISTMPKGTAFHELPDSYVIFITENDVLKGNQATYIIERGIVGRNEWFNDGAHIIYVNGAYKGVESPVGKLIHDFIPELQNAELDESSTINTDTNIDSLSLIMLITKVESTFDVRIPRKEWNKINTLGELLDKVEQYRK